MEYRKLPRGEERVSVLGLGMGGIQQCSDLEIEQVIHKAIEHGINFFDLCGGGKVCDRLYARNQQEGNQHQVIYGHGALQCPNDKPLLPAGSPI